MSCARINANLLATCASLKRAGGIQPKVWIGNLADLDAYTQDGTTKDITAITLVSGAYLWTYTGKRDKHSGNIELQTGENVNTFKQILNLVLYTSTSLDEEKVEALCNAEDLFVIAQENDGQCSIWGLDLSAGTTASPAGGLNCEAATKGTGALVNERTPWSVTLSGQIRNADRRFINTGTLAATLTYLATLES